MNLGTVTARLDDRLDTQRFADIDGSLNGLQVGDPDWELERAAFAVDAAQATIDAAVDWDADVLVTHHGLWWEGTERLTGPTFERVASLIEHRIGLYVSHLPLDAHPRLGNAAGVAEVLSLEDQAAFGGYDGEQIGRAGALPRPRSVEAIADTLADVLETGPGSVRTLEFGSDPVEEVAIVTGAGVDWIDEADREGMDLLVTGEGAQHAYHEAREVELHVILAGHYATETFGVRSLMELVDEWGIETAFIAHPTGI